MDISLILGITTLTYLLYVTKQEYQRRLSNNQQFSEGLVMAKHKPPQTPSRPSNRFQN